MRASKPWQYGNMNLYRAIRNCMWYWGARMILEVNANDAMALSCRLHPAERRDIARINMRRRYWRLRRSGLSSDAAMARMHGQTIEKYRADHRRRRLALMKRWGGDPRAGTSAYNRRVLATCWTVAG